MQTPSSKATVERDGPCSSGASLCGCSWKGSLLLLERVGQQGGEAVLVPSPESPPLASQLPSFACRRMPSLLEYLSYNCNFMGILAGPLCSYKDYITFIEGRSYHVAQAGADGKEKPHREPLEPSPNVRAPESPGAFTARADGPVH